MSATPATVRQTRNILANELGLTLEAVEEMVRKRVDEKLAGLPLEKIVATTVANYLSRAISERAHFTPSLKDMIMGEIRDQVSKRVDVRVNLKEPS